MKYAKLDGAHIVANVSDTPREGWIEVADTVTIGCPRNHDGSFDPPLDGYQPPAPPAPPALDAWRFFAVLSLSGKDAALDAYLEALPEPEQTVTRSKLAHVERFERNDPTLLAAKEALAIPDDEFDTLWSQGLALS